MAKAKQNKGQHSKGSKRWGTPEDLVERARRCMGTIDLDPFSEPKFQETVKATRWHGPGSPYSEDGLIPDWAWYGVLTPEPTCCFVNPPGGLVREAWRKLITEHARGYVKQAIWIGFNVEQLCILADEQCHPTEFLCLYNRSRIPFIRHDGYEGSPAHANYIVSIGVTDTDFEREFADLGRIVKGIRCG